MDMRDLNPVMSVKLARYIENINSNVREFAVLLHLQREVNQPKRPVLWELWVIAREGREPTTIMFNSATIQLKITGKENKEIFKITKWKLKIIL